MIVIVLLLGHTVSTLKCVADAFWQDSLSLLSEYDPFVTAWFGLGKDQDLEANVWSAHPSTLTSSMADLCLYKYKKLHWALVVDTIHLLCEYM